MNGSELAREYNVGNTFSEVIASLEAYLTLPANLRQGDVVKKLDDRYSSTQSAPDSMGRFCFGSGTF